MTIYEVLELLKVGESIDIEFKSAKGGLPKSLWETFSAFANTAGGVIVLGVVEKDNGEFAIEGIKHPDRLLKTFWDGHNNSQKLSVPICRHEDVDTINIDGKAVVVIRVPKTKRTQRPVYINGNLYGGTFKRSHEGDYHCSEEEVKRMLRDASDEPLDYDILEHFDLDDIDMETLNAYRNRFRSRVADHPYLELSDKDFLMQLGGYRRDRREEREGLTVAGLLMFGKESSIKEAFPYFYLDYREKLSEDPEERWNYRLTPDGTWQANLYNFYFKVYNRLIQDIEVPFALDSEGVRLGETHVHEALREVLANTLIHADHTMSKSIVIIKEREIMRFRNPGRLRITVAQLYRGGVSDPRNPHLQRMFQFLGLGEKAGSGFAKILRAWREQEWLQPLVFEEYDNDMTVVLLPMLSMVPDHIHDELERILGSEYQQTDELQRLILILAHQFETVSNSEISAYSDKHPYDIGQELRKMVQKGWLVQQGRGRGVRYHLKSKGQVGGQVGGQLGGQVEQNPEVTVVEWRILQSLAQGAKSSSEIRAELGGKSIDLPGSFKKRLATLREEKRLIEYTIPDKPRSSQQKYRLTEKGRLLLKKGRQ